MLKWNDLEFPNEDRAERNRRQDDDFCRALRAALYARKESCPIDENTEPGTKKPITSFQLRD